MATMTDIKSWVEERRAIHAAATDGRWELIGGGEYVAPAGILVASDDGGVSASDAAAIVDAHNMFPRALDALSAVLELHKPLGYIGRDGETVWDECEHCHGPGWPCETVQAIEGAINHE